MRIILLLLLSLAIANTKNDPNITNGAQRSSILYYDSVSVSYDGWIE